MRKYAICLLTMLLALVMSLAGVVCAQGGGRWMKLMVLIM